MVRITPLQRLLLDVEALAVRFETLRLELVTIVWQLREQVHRHAVDTPRPPPTKTRTRKRAAR